MRSLRRLPPVAVIILAFSLMLPVSASIMAACRPKPLNRQVTLTLTLRTRNGWHVSASEGLEYRFVGRGGDTGWLPYLGRHRPIGHVSHSGPYTIFVRGGAYQPKSKRICVNSKIRPFPIVVYLQQKR